MASEYRDALIKLMEAVSDLFDQRDIGKAIEAAPPDVRDRLKEAMAEAFRVVGPEGNGER